MKDFAIYIRVSTQKQGRSGLGLESQKQICNDFIKANNGKCIAEFMDVESGTHRDRKGLQEAITFCQANKCGLVIAKLDRLCRDVEFCFRVVNTGIEIHFCDMPTINTLLLGVFAAVAQYERELTSDRTKKALAVKKAQGCKLGAASEKYKETYNNKTFDELKEITMKRGETKNRRRMEDRDTVAMLRILRNVFPSATENEDPKEWDWSSVTTRGDYKERIYALMQDYRELDNDLFRRWDFEIEKNKLQVKLAAYLQSLKKSVMY